MFLQRMYNYLYCVDEMACFTKVCQSFSVLRLHVAVYIVCLDRSPHYPLLKKKMFYNLLSVTCLDVDSV